MGLFKKVITGIFDKKKEFNDDFFESLEERLVEADVGITTTNLIIERLREDIKINKFKTADELQESLKNILNDIIIEGALIREKGLKIVFFTGINGVGKTTSLAKLANYLKQQNYRVKIGAGDTFRAAAIEQLGIWAERIGIPIIKHKLGSDSGAVVYDSISSALADNTDYLIIDTAGRMHTSSDLMRELQKLRKITLKRIPEEQIENIIVVDSTAGQNSFVQVKTFNDYIPVTGIFLSKYDSSSKGGIIVRICSELKKPIKFLGTGETLNDFEIFSKEKFINEIV